MTTLPLIPEQHLRAARRVLAQTWRFETPDRLPFFIYETPEDHDPARGRFADAHAVEAQLGRWGDWDKQLEEFIQGLDWWSRQNISPLAAPPRIPMFCPQETILTPFGVAHERLPNGRVHIGFHEPVIKDLSRDIDRLVESGDGFLGRGLLPDLLDRARWFLDKTNREHAIGYPDFQSPLGLASKLMDSTDFMIWLVEEPAEIRRLLLFLADRIVDLVHELERIAGSPELVQSPYILPDWLKGTIWDDYVSVIGPHTYREVALEANHRVLSAFGGGHLHTCGPCIGPFTDAILANEQVSSFDVIFADRERTRTTEHLRSLKRKCHGRAVLNVIGMPYDLENFDVDFVREMKDGGGVLFMGCGGSRDQMRRWHDVIEKA